MSNSETLPARTRVTRAPVPVDRCGMARAIELLGDRWTLLILREAFYGVTRFADLRADLSAPRAVLSQRLDHLVQAEIMQRRPYQDEGSRTRFDYHLTEKGRELALVLFALMQWGDRYLRNDPAPLKVVDSKTGDPLAVALVTRTGRVVPVTRARAVPTGSR